MKKIIALTTLIIIITIIVFVSVFETESENNSSRNATKNTITIGYQANLISTPIVIAKHNGYFKKAGLDIKLIPFVSGKLALIDMLKGHENLSTAADFPVVIQSGEHPNLRLYTTFAATDTEKMIIAKKSQGIFKPNDLIGKRIGVQKNSAVHYFLEMYLISHNISIDKVKIVYMPAKNLPEALVSGKIDAFSMRNPFIDMAKKLLPNDTVILAEPIYNMTFNLLSTKQFAQAHPEIIQKIIASLIKAEQYIHHNPNKSLKIMSQSLKSQSLAALKKDWPLYHFKVALSQNMLLTLENQENWAKKLGLLPKNTSTNFLNVIDLTPLLQIAPDRVSIIEAKRQNLRPYSLAH